MALESWKSKLRMAALHRISKDLRMGLLAFVFFVRLLWSKLAKTPYKYKSYA